MNKAGMALLTTVLATGALAQDSYEEHVYAFNIGTEILADDLFDRCRDLLGTTQITGIDLDGEYTAAYKVPLYRPKFHRDGERKDHKYGRKQIGEMLLCLDWSSYVYGAIEFANFIPAFFEVTIDGRTFLAQGGGFHPLGGDIRLAGGGQFMTPNEGDLAYPAPQVYPVNFNATILPSVSASALDELGIFDENAGLGGSMSLNYVYDSGDPDDLDDAFEDDALGLIRLYVPEEE